MSNQNPATMHQVEELLLQTGDGLNEVAYEQFVEGHLSTEGLETLYSGIREWSKLSEQLLKLLNRT